MLIWIIYAICKQEGKIVVSWTLTYVRAYQVKTSMHAHVSFGELVDYWLSQIKIGHKESYEFWGEGYQKSTEVALITLKACYRSPKASILMSFMSHYTATSEALLQPPVVWRCSLGCCRCTRLQEACKGKRMLSLRAGPKQNNKHDKTYMNASYIYFGSLMDKKVNKINQNGILNK